MSTIESFFNVQLKCHQLVLPFFPLLVFPMGMRWHLKPNHPSISAMRLCMSKLPWRCVVNWGILHDMAFPPQIKSKPRMLDAGIPILHTNLELVPSASHHSQEFLSDNHTEALFWPRKKIHTVYRGLMGFVYTFSSPCGNPWRGLAEDHGTNLLFKTWFMNNLLLSISRNSFSKILETFLEQIRWCHSCKKVDGRQFCWKHCSSFSPQVRQRKFFNRLVNSPPNSSFLTTLLLMRPMWPRSWPCDKSIRKFFFSICIELLVFPEVRECSPAPQKNAHFFCIWQSLSMDPKVRRSTPNSSM